MTKKRTWKFWIGRTTLGLLIIGGLWATIKSYEASI